MKISPALRLALVQTTLHWQQPQANLAHFETILRNLPSGIDLAVLPEMFTTGYSMTPQDVAETVGGEVHLWLAKLSTELGFAICGSVATLENGQYYNRLLWAEAGITRAVYNKHHLFRIAGEHEVYHPGNVQGTFTFRGWKVMPRICYDLRFPVWNRSTDCDLQLYVANWPAPRIDAWDKLLMARAIENVCYVAGVNRVGTDGNGSVYPGHTAVYNYLGRNAASASSKAEEVVICTLDHEELMAFRQKFPVHLDADRFRLEP